MTIIRKKSFSLKNLLLFLFFIGFLKPAAFLAVPFLDTFFNIWRVFSALFILLIILFEGFSISKITRLLIAFEFFLLGVTLFRGGDLFQCLINVITVSGEVLLFDYVLKNDFHYFISKSSYICCFLILVNFLFMFLVPQGFSINQRGSIYYFLGIHNRFIYWFLPCLTIIVMDSVLKYKRIRWWVYLVFIVSLISLLITNSVGGFVGCLVFGFLCFVYSMKKHINNLYLLFFFIICLVWIVLVFTSFSDALSTLISSLGKTESFSARITLWQQARDSIWLDFSYFFFGYGVESNEVLMLKFTYVHVHNNFLNVFYQTGLIGFVMYLMSFILIIKPMKKTKDLSFARIISATLIAFLIILLFDTYDLYGHLFAILVIAYNLPYISKKYYRCRNIYFFRFLEN